MTISKKELPKYTFKEEIFNAVTHGIGFLFALGVLIYFIVKQVTNSYSFGEIYPYYLYVLSMMIVFVFSTLYHTSKFDSNYRVISRIIDHADIYLFVAGTYFPICMFGVLPHNLGIIMAVIELVFAVYGILVNVIPNHSKALEISAYIVYIIQGWLLVFFLPFGAKVALNVFLPTLIGGIVYSVGAILYAIGKKRPYFHTIFHIFVDLGAIIQFVAIFNLLG